MRRFRFKLQAVLQQREAAERNRLLALAGFQQEMRACEERIEAIVCERARVLADWPRNVDLQDYALREAYLDGLDAKAQRETELRETIADRLERARDALVEARRARESITRLKEHAYEQYVAEARREEQATLDDLAVLRHRRSHATIA
ncbi:MAG TPA: flagellar export protein FliJ [Chthonomonadales bacterium]|nr:flagellar export protein FliJ [Chthonomonadales bacterium]